MNNHRFPIKKASPIFFWPRAWPPDPKPDTAAAPVRIHFKMNQFFFNPEERPKHFLNDHEPHFLHRASGANSLKLIYNRILQPQLRPEVDNQVSFSLTPTTFLQPLSVVKLDQELSPPRSSCFSSEPLINILVKTSCVKYR